MFLFAVLLGIALSIINAEASVSLIIENFTQEEVYTTVNGRIRYQARYISGSEKGLSGNGFLLSRQVPISDLQLRVRHQDGDHSSGFDQIPEAKSIIKQMEVLVARSFRHVTAESAEDRDAADHFFPLLNWMLQDIRSPIVQPVQGTILSYPVEKYFARDINHEIGELWIMCLLEGYEEEYLKCRWTLGSYYLGRGVYVLVTLDSLAFLSREGLQSLVTDTMAQGYTWLLTIKRPPTQRSFSLYHWLPFMVGLPAVTTLWILKRCLFSGAERDTPDTLRKVKREKNKKRQKPRTVKPPSEVTGTGICDCTDSTQNRDASALTSNCLNEQAQGAAGGNEQNKGISVPSLRVPVADIVADIIHKDLNNAYREKNFKTVLTKLVRKYGPEEVIYVIEKDPKLLGKFRGYLKDIPLNDEELRPLKRLLR